MFACICRAVTTDQVNAAIDSEAATLSAVARASRACTGCGMYRERIADMLATIKAERPLEMAETQAA